MLKYKLFALILMTFSPCFFSDTFGVETSDFFSPSIADAFRDKAIDLYSDPNATASDARQAMVFLEAADKLDRNMGYALPDMVRLAWRFPSVNIYNRIMPVFVKYAVNDDADLEVLRLGVQYLLEPLNIREQREEFFRRVLKLINTRHALFASDISTQLGLLAAEHVDMESTRFSVGAVSYLMQAYSENPYNKIAFQKLMEINPADMSPAIYIRHLRLMMGANPYDIDAAYAFANGAYNVGLYDVAASAYEYCADLFAVLHPNEPLPAAIYMPWALSSYNDPKSLKQCLNINHLIGKSGSFDLYLEAVAGNAALKLGNTEEGNKILAAAAQKAVQNASAAHDLAWFYCFAQPNPEKAMEWANKANSADANSPRTAAILAYALVMNGQHEVAKPLVEQDYRGNQIAGLAMGQIQLALDPNADPNTTFGIIKSAIAFDAGSLEAQRGKELLTQKGSTYVPVYETAGILKALQADFGDAIVNKFVTADKLLAVKITTTGNEFPYGGHFNANLAITNKGNDPLVIFDGGLFNGNIRVDAVVKGDLKERIPNLVVKKIRPSEPLESGRSLFIPLKLIQGRLAHLLMEHPQASVEIEFTAWLDPVKDQKGEVHNAIAAIEPVRLVVRRNGVDVSSTYLQTRLSSLVQGQLGQKIKSVQLFAGLLLEQQATMRVKPYKITYVDPQLLRSGLARGLADENWAIRVETMLLLDDVPIDYNLKNAVSESLGNDFWPVRMTALWLLGKDNAPAFRRVCDWTAKNDSDKIVLEMAAALGASIPQQASEPNSEPNTPVETNVAGKSNLPSTPVIKTMPPSTPVLEKANLPEPNQPEKVISSEPNQPQKEKAGEPNDIIENILKS